jgi:hypothetical protein
MREIMIFYEFNYYDRKLKKLIFKCKATSYREADKIFEKEIGADPMKLKDVRVSYSGSAWDEINKARIGQ